MFSFFSRFSHNYSNPAFFTFQNKTLPYLNHPQALLSERAIEVPIAFDFARNSKTASPILEIGNTLQQYIVKADFPAEHAFLKRTIVDKFEKAPGVQNTDLFDLPLSSPYRTIICISTVEHVGQASDPQQVYGESKKTRNLLDPLMAIRHIYDLLESNGNALITVPFGKLIDGGWYIQFSNEYIKALHSHYHLPRKDMRYTVMMRHHSLKQVDHSYPEWHESKMKDAADAEYNYPHNFANAILVIEINKESSSTKPLPPPKKLPPKLFFEEPFA